MFSGEEIIYLRLFFVFILTLVVFSQGCSPVGEALRDPLDLLDADSLSNSSDPSNGGESVSNEENENTVDYGEPPVSGNLPPLDNLNVNCEMIAGQGKSFYEENLTYVDLSDETRLPTSSPESQGMKRALLDQAEIELENTSNTLSFLVVRNGSLIKEAYFRGSKASHANNIHSASKSILSAAIGVALQKKIIQNVDQKISELLPNYNFPGEMTNLRLSDLLSMTGGLQWTEDLTEYQIDNNPSWVQAILNLNSIYPPGQKFHYNTGLSHLASAVLTEASGMSTCEFAHRYLLGPLGIDVERWGRDPDGYFSGGYNFFITPREMAKFGLLYLNGGMVDGRQIVSQQWINESSQANGPASYYGYLWWLEKSNSYSFYRAWGYGKQFIYVIPDLNIVVVVTSDTKSNVQDGDLNNIIKDYIIPATQ